MMLVNSISRLKIGNITTLANEFLPGQHRRFLVECLRVLWEERLSGEARLVRRLVYIGP